MDMIMKFIDPYWRQVLAWWHSLGSQGPYIVWIVSGVMGLLVILWVSYQLIRRLLGYKKIFGVWFRPGELDPLLDRLEQSEKNGTILQLRDATLLDMYRPDRRPHLKKIRDGDFVTW